MAVHFQPYNWTIDLGLMWDLGKIDHLQTKLLIIIMSVSGIQVVQNNRSRPTLVLNTNSTTKQLSSGKFVIAGNNTGTIQCQSILFDRLHCIDRDKLTVQYCNRAYVGMIKDWWVKSAYI